VNCANCGVTLYGRYCADCGQRRGSAPPTVGHLVAETFETLTHADSRLWRTLRALLTRPGSVTLDYFAGRRARHLPPLRLYIVASVTCFLLLALLPSRGPQADPAAQPTATAARGSARRSCAACRRRCSCCCRCSRCCRSRSTGGPVACTSNT
jgi:hypothetical protein